MLDDTYEPLGRAGAAGLPPAACWPASMPAWRCAPPTVRNRSPPGAPILVHGRAAAWPTPRSSPRHARSIQPRRVRPPAPAAAVAPTTVRRTGSRGAGCSAAKAPCRPLCRRRRRSPGTRGRRLPGVGIGHAAAAQARGFSDRTAKRPATLVRRRRPSQARGRRTGPPRRRGGRRSARRRQEAAARRANEEEARRAAAAKAGQDARRQRGCASTKAEAGRRRAPCRRAGSRPSKRAAAEARAAAGATTRRAGRGEALAAAEAGRQRPRRRCGPVEGRCGGVSEADADAAAQAARSKRRARSKRNSRPSGKRTRKRAGRPRPTQSRRRQGGPCPGRRGAAQGGR